MEYPQSVQIHSLARRSDLQISLRSITPPNPSALLIVIHGLGEHAGRYEHVMRYFAERGMAAVGFDLRGHGNSGGRRGDIDHVRTWLDDTHAVISHARARFRAHIPVVMYGHSMGGLIALAYAEERPFDLAGLILSAPAIRPMPDMSWAYKLMIDLAGVVVPWLKGGTGIDPARISADPQVVASYAEDPLVEHRCTARCARTIFRQAARAYREPHRLACPVLIVQERGDRVCHQSGARSLYARIDAEKKLILYDGRYHEPHNDIIKERVLGDIHGWVANLPALSAVAKPAALG